MTQTLDRAAQLAEWHRKALSNELTTAEIAEWVAHCRAGRVTAAATSAKARARKEPPNVADMMDELENLT